MHKGNEFIRFDYKVSSESSRRNGILGSVLEIEDHGSCRRVA